MRIGRLILGFLLAASVVTLAPSAGATTFAATTAWTHSPSANVYRTGADILSGVTTVSSSNAWAVGKHKSSRGHVSTLVLHWDGTTWRVVPSPNVGDSSLNAVTATSSNDALAVGVGTDKALIEHWDGTDWQVQTIPSTTYGAALFDVTATSSTSAWAVGYDLVAGYYGYFPESLIFQLSGTTWTRQNVADAGPGGDILYGVVATSPTNAWAVGTFQDENLTPQMLVQHWDGYAWSQQTAGSSNTWSHAFHSVAASSSSDAWAVGNTRARSLIEHCC
jgi:hypothetical protein